MHYLPFTLIVYTIAYGAPAEVDPYEGWKVFGGTVAVLAFGTGLFALVRSGGKRRFGEQQLRRGMTTDRNLIECSQSGSRHLVA